MIPERSPGAGSLFSEPGKTAKGFLKLQANMSRSVFHKGHVGCSVENTDRREDA